MECPKCHSENLYQVNSEQCLCRDCENTFKPEKPLINQVKSLDSVKTKMDKEDEILAELKKINATIRDFQKNVGKTILLAILASGVILLFISLFI